MISGSCFVCLCPLITQCVLQGRNKCHHLAPFHVGGGRRDGTPGCQCERLHIRLDMWHGPTGRAHLSRMTWHILGYILGHIPGPFQGAFSEITVTEGTVQPSQRPLTLYHPHQVYLLLPRCANTFRRLTTGEFIAVIPFCQHTCGRMTVFWGRMNCYINPIFTHVGTTDQ